MLKSIFTSCVVITIVSLLFFTSCSNDDTTKTQEDIIVSDSPQVRSVLAADTELIKPIEGVMDTLYIDKNIFQKLPEKRMALKYFINTDGALTLHGWPTKSDINNDEYDVGGEIELKNGNPTDKPPVNYGPGSFLGGVILKKAQIKDIQGLLKKRENSTILYVVFVPEKDSEYPGHFIYNIFLADYIPLKAFYKTSILSLIPANQVAKPSPPHNS